MTDWNKWPIDVKHVDTHNDFTVHQLDEDQLPKSIPGENFGLLRISFGGNGEVALYDQFGNASATLHGNGSPGTSIAVDGEQTEIVTAHRDGTVCRWDLRQPYQMLIEVIEGVSPSVAFAPDGDAVYVGSRGKPVQVWEINAAKGLFQGMLGWRPATPRHGSHAAQLAFSPDGRRLAVATDSQWGFSRWLVYDLWTGLAQHAESNAEIGDVRCVDWSPDGKWIAVGGKTYGNNDGLFRIYDAGTYQASARLEGGTGGVHAVSFSRDSQRVATAAEDGTLRIWDVSTGALLHTLGKPGDSAVLCAVHSPEGSVLLSGSADGTIAAWNPQSGEQVFRARIHGAAVNSMAFTPDGRRLMTVSDDGSLRVLDPATWRELLTLGLPEPARAMSFSPDGRRLALLRGRNNRLMFLEVESEAERSSLRRRRQTCETEAEAILQAVLKDTTDPVEARMRIIDGTAADQTLREAALEKLRQWLGNRWFAAYLLQTTDSLKSQILRQQLVFSADQVPSETQGLQLIAGMDAIQRQALSDVAHIYQVTEPAFVINGQRQTLVGGNVLKKKLDTREFAWEIVSNPARNSDDQLLACFGMQPVVRAYPQSASSLITMAWAEYRVGLYGDALDSAERAAAMSQDASVSARCLAVIGMCQHRMGQTEAGIATRERLIEVMKQSGDRDPTTVALVDEAQKVLANPVETLWDEQAALSALTTRAEKVLGPKRTAILLASLAERKSRRFLERGDLEAAKSSHQTARALLEEQLTAANAGGDMGLDLSQVARVLAELLLAKDESNLWSVLKPLEMKSQGGATLTLLEDGSVLASGTNPDQDTCEITAKVGLQRITAIQLEVIPDASLPQNGPGRFPDNGNFHLNEFRVLINGQPHTPAKVVVSYGEHEQHRHIIDGTIDGNHWSIHPRSGQQHSAVIMTDIELAADDLLTVELVSSRWKYPQHNPGRFRLSVSDHPDAYAYASVTEPDDPFERLAVAYHLIGDEEALGNLVEHHPQVATAIGNLYAKVEYWQRAIEEYSKWIADQPADVTLLTKRAAAYIATEQWDLAKADWQRAVELQPELAQTAFDAFSFLQRWSEASVFGLLLLKQKPEDSVQWVSTPPTIALANDAAAYRRCCQIIVENYRRSPTGQAAERAIKGCLLLPGAIDVAELPGELLTESLNNGTLPEGIRSWGWFSLALLAYRSGDAETAVKHVTQSEQLNPADEHNHAINFAVLALAQHQLKHSDEARKALDEASQVIQRRQAIDRNHHDLLIAEILFREAETKINGKESPVP